MSANRAAGTSRAIARFNGSGLKRFAANTPLATDHASTAATSFLRSASAVSTTVS